MLEITNDTDPASIGGPGREKLRGFAGATSAHDTTCNHGHVALPQVP